MLAIQQSRFSLRSWLAWYHLASGLAGVVVTAIYASTLVERTPADFRTAMGLLLLGMLALFAVAAWAGILLMMGTRWAVRVATCVQLAQVPVFIIGGWQWIFFAGVYLVVAWGFPGDIRAFVGMKASLQIAWSGEQGTMLGVNVAPFFILWLLRYRLPALERPRDASAPAMSALPLEVEPPAPTSAWHEPSSTSAMTLPPPALAPAGPTCKQSRFSPQVRLVITFGVLFALKWSLPLLGLVPTVQVLILLVVATYLAWLFWWNCSTHRRGPLLLIGSLWIGGLAKILLR
jgi:hypothetical protein